MRKLSRIVFAAAVVAGFGGVAQAQSQSRYTQVSPDRYFALSDDRGDVVERLAVPHGAVPPSESRTVMGLSVPH